MKKILAISILSVSLLSSAQTNSDTLAVAVDSTLNDSLHAESSKVLLEAADSTEEKRVLKSIDNLNNTWYAKKSLDTLTLKRRLNPEVIPDFPDSVYIQRLAAIETEIPMTFNKKVKSFIDLYTKKRRKQVEVMLGLSKYYFPIFENELYAKGMPLELKYLPVIESAINPRAVSYVYATGLWQFMYGTAKMYKLKMNNYIDERRDPYESTKAATRCLSDLYKKYKDWHMVIAAYNCGPGNVDRAIRRSGGKRDIWQIYPFLPRETRGYIPIFIAATYVMTYHEEHNLYPAIVDIPQNVDTVVVNQNIHVKQISEVLNIPVDMIRDLNPHFTKDIVPGKYGPQPIKLPYENIGAFIDMQDSIVSYKKEKYMPSKKLVVQPAKWTRKGYVHPTPRGKAKILYKVRSGDNLGYISDWYNVSVRRLKYWNNIRKSNIRVGQKLTVFVPKSKKKYYSKINSMSYVDKQALAGKTVKPRVHKPKSNVKYDPSKEYVYYTVRKRDNLWKIAKKYNGVSMDDIIQLNSLANSDALKPGMKLMIKEKI